MLHQVTAVAAVIVLYADARRSRFVINDVESDAELRNIQLKVLNLKRLTFANILADHTHLVGEHDFSREVVVVGNLREGIVFVPQGLIEVFAGLVQELHHALFANLGTQCQRVDKHANGVANAKVGTAVAEGSDAQLLVIGEARKCVECCGQGEVCRREVVLTAETLSRIEIQPADDRFNNALLLGIGQV